MIRMPELESNGAPVQVECPAHRALCGCHAPDEGLAQVSLHGHRPDPHVLQGPQPGACVQLGSLLRVLPRILLRVLLKVLSRVLLSVLLRVLPRVLLWVLSRVLLGVLPRVLLKVLPRVLSRVLPRVLLSVMLRVLSRVLLSVLLLACPQSSH